MTERFVGDDLSYTPAHGPVLLLSCMDPRLLDDTLHFMNHDNLTNRYDHVILAGSALGAVGGNLPQFEHWRKTFWDHVAGAVELHNIEDVYIIEHRHCGAYHKIFKVAPEFGDTPEEMAAEAELHLQYAEQLTNELHTWSETHHHPLRVRSFLMDVRGRVAPLLHPQRSKAKKKTAKKKSR